MCQKEELPSLDLRSFHCRRLHGYHCAHLRLTVRLILSHIVPELTSSLVMWLTPGILGNRSQRQRANKLTLEDKNEARGGQAAGLLATEPSAMKIKVPLMGTSSNWILWFSFHFSCPFLLTLCIWSGCGGRKERNCYNYANTKIH